MSQYIGEPITRVDGHEKVTGQAKYAAEFNVPDLTYGVVVSSTITKGRITLLDTSKALAVNGVIEVFTHENRPRTAWFDISYKDQDSPPGSPFRPLYDNKIKYNGQPVALVVAETFELARFAAMLVHVEYEAEPCDTDLMKHLDTVRNPEPGLMNLMKPLPPKPRGDADKAFAEAPVQQSAQYIHGMQHHNPMEMFASTVEYGKNGFLTIYDKTQGVTNSLLYVTQAFNIPFNQVRVVSPYVGGAFGSGLRPQYQLFLAVMAARELKRSVRVSLTRQQMWSFGHRPATVQNVCLGTQADGTITAIIHEAKAATSQFEDYTEEVVNWTGKLYPTPNGALRYKLKSLDIYTPLDMRAPGGVTGLSAVECAVDELAYKLGMDPLEFRLKNYTERDWTEKDRPFSSKELRACFRQGAERFGWSGRNPEPRSMRKDHNLIGWGMATGIWDAAQVPARAEATLTVNGKLRVRSATADIGTGTYTIMTQIAADTLGMPIDDVVFRLGDTTMPAAPIEGGSWTASTVGSAVKSACDTLAKTLFRMAKRIPKSPFVGVGFDDVLFINGEIRLKRNPSARVSLLEVVNLNGGRAITETGTSIPNLVAHMKYSRNAHAAAFVEVQVDEDFGTVKVTRAISAVAAGRIINPRTARSQIIGGMVWGISHALQEESVMDHRYGRFMNHDLAEYHIPVCADIHEMDVVFVEENDTVVNPLGVKGVGEIGLVAMPAAIANAIFHATGKRIYELPIQLDKVM
ncbi:aldehyde oxidase and xanthine dehydrogenase molybdopterin binding protein [Fibrisoma limi BUZ 3]|uniref:Aldehyde oxidase and xanthine dehydrogenase molybdopterin binding protein n=1 Tax=Fibrisoma limi BUZ 3 TaxID=1185876 RepID=I2GJG0_9BACT|nr:xanthine dehydrogenase family protein molybdopterin-binding subunit [Fibrisoma limi]CCH54035.1 aldehyde oxidase and xanthine dehydrogenase molybdopterin binding protein [Fibrisoma limi BUZ 3]